MPGLREGRQEVHGGADASSVYSTAEWVAWLASIRDMPDDDNRRLIAADFLEERGEGERAGWIRYAVELPHCEFTWMVDSSQNRPGELLGLHGWGWAGDDNNGSYLIHGRLRYRIDRGFVHTVRGPLGPLVGERGCNRCVGGGSACDQPGTKTVNGGTLRTRFSARSRCMKTTGVTASMSITTKAAAGANRVKTAW